MNWLQRNTGLPRRFGTSEGVLLLAALFVLACGFGFVKLADEVKEGETQSFDERVLRSLRRADAPAVPVGPAWLREASLDVTALGSPVVLVLMLAAVAGFLWLKRHPGMALLTVVTGSGALVSTLLKSLVARDRPTVVPHLRDVASSSFPSGHAMLSAVVYLTLGTMLTQVVPGRAAKAYCLLWAMLLSFLVGLSHIYLGVHYPTDVLAGWTAGVAWAFGWWAAFQYVRRGRSAAKKEDAPQSPSQ